MESVQPMEMKGMRGMENGSLEAKREVKTLFDLSAAEYGGGLIVGPANWKEREAAR